MMIKFAFGAVCFAIAFSGSTAFAQTSTRPHKRAHHEMVYDPSTRSVLLVGGSTPNPDESFIFFNDIWRYVNNTWSLVARAGDERSGIRLAYDSKRNKIYSFGGFSSNNQSSGQLRVLEENVWKIVTDVPEMKSAEPGFVYDSKRDKFIAFGGSAAQRQVNNTTWEWDGKEWKKSAATGPEGRQGFVMVFDSKRNKTILYGGMDGNGKKFNDGIWEFDGTAWKNVIDKESGPGPRLSPGYCYDSKRGMLILFGGVSNDKIVGDTWGWDGKRWTKLAADGPTPRIMGYIAYDESRDRVVLFGGRISWPNDVDDTWEFDGKKWSRK